MTNERIQRPLKNADTHASDAFTKLMGVTLILASAIVLALLFGAFWVLANELTAAFTGACWLTACCTLVAGISILKNRT